MENTANILHCRFSEESAFIRLPDHTFCMGEIVLQMFGAQPHPHYTDQCGSSGDIWEA